MKKMSEDDTLYPQKKDKKQLLVPSSEGLFPCPFCGGEAILHKSEDGEYYYPRCKKGKMNGYYWTDNNCIGNQGWWGMSTSKEAIDAWNRRA